MVRLSLRPGQEQFVSPPAWSLARCYVRGWGEQYDYLPMAICDGATIVGYVTIISDPRSRDDYWIDDIMVDGLYQGRGFGREAMLQVLQLIASRYARCQGIKLTCFRANTKAAALYNSLGFKMTSETDPMFSEPVYSLTGAELEVYRQKAARD